MNSLANRVKAIAHALPETSPQREDLIILACDIEAVSDDEPSSMIRLSLSDAAKNCADHSDARVTLTLRSGVQLKGSLDRDSLGFAISAHLQNDLGGWATIDAAEIVAVETWRKENRGGRF